VDRERILTIGFKLEWRQSGVINAPNFNEFDLIIWHPEGSFAELLNDRNAQNVAAYSTKLEKLIEWVTLGHALIVVVTPLSSFDYLADNGKISKFSLAKRPPLLGVVLEQAAGKLIEYCGPESLRNSISPFLSHVEYSVVLKSSELTPLLKVSESRFGSEQIVGGFKRIGAGFVIFAPPWRDGTTAEWISIYFSNLAELPDILSAGTSEQLPPWSKEYQTDREKAASEQIKELEAQISSIRSTVETQKTIVQEDQDLKHLFSGSGEAFAAVVAKALGELGLNTVEGPRGRADLIGYDGKCVAAFEVKGLDNAARENNLRQTERWVADIKSALTATDEQKKADKDLGSYAQKLAELGVPTDAAVDCKGIMIIGTYRKTPVSERSDTGFPDPVARPINRSNVCALSGLQLLGLLLGTRKGHEAGSDVLARIFSKNGVFEEAADWRVFLNLAESVSHG
jgi:hypothetical protein